MTTPAPVTPTLSITTDKQTYSIGDAITVTANYSDSSTTPVVLTVTATATDAAGVNVTATATATVNTTAQQPMSVTVSDSFNDSYTQQSNAGGVAVFTSTIGTPPGA